jgi:hypothetical protein
MPLIKFTASKCYTLFTISISLNREIMSPYSCYIKKGLVYIALISPFRYQPSFYLECTKINTQLLYNIHFIPLNKCICLTAHC